MTEPDHDSTLLLLQAYVDGELDAASSLAFDARLAREPDLAAARDKLLALRRRLVQNLPRQAASDRLRRAMAAQADIGAPERSKGFLRSDWRMALAACLVGAAMTYLMSMPRAPAPVMAEVVADHLRAVMAPQPFDVASSDQHTVKPWFTGRVPFAPQVFDLAPAGFTLMGGRVDVLAGQPAATLVFRHGKHLISLTSQPIGEAAPTRRLSTDDRGFLVRDWEIGAMHYWAVSDIATDELDAFEKAARAHLAGAE